MNEITSVTVRGGLAVVSLSGVEEPIVLGEGERLQHSERLHGNVRVREFEWLLWTKDKCVTVMRWVTAG